MMSTKFFKSSVIFLFFFLTVFSVSAQFNLFKTPNHFEQKSAFLPASEAFSFNFKQQDDFVTLTWDILPDYYLYQDKIQITPSQDTQIGPIQFPQSIPHQDEFFGQVGIYKQHLLLSVPLLKATDQSSLSISFQGCAAAGFCYPPETVNLPLSAINHLKPTDQTSNSSIDTAAVDSSETIQTALENAPVNQGISLKHLADNWWQPLLFLGLGIGLAFTPCVLPMYPILTGIVLGGGKRSHRQTFRLSMLYVQGMALTYTLLGLVVASAGVQFQAALQHPWVLIGLSGVFVLLAAAMFGAINLQLPAQIQTKLSQLSNQQTGGNAWGVFTMGAISGLICSPCTTAPLSGALLYVAQSGDLLTGAVTLYALALGMGIPLILAAMFGNKLLPQAGNWMNHVKTFFGFVLLAAALFLLERILSPNFSIALWLSWGFILSTWILHICRQFNGRKLSTFFSALAILGISLTAVISYHTWRTPSQVNQVQVKFQTINSIDELNQALKQAKTAKQAVMLDFYADWCTACKEFEKYTFHDPKVAQSLRDMTLLQIDVTQTTPASVKLLNELQVLGLPTIDFWNQNGERLPQARLTGFVEATPFLQHLSSYQLSNTLQ